MKAAVKAQFEAHVAFELERLQGDGADSFLREELTLLWETVGKLTLKQLLPPKAIVATIERQVIEGPVTASTQALISDVAVRLIESPANREAQIGSLIADGPRKALVAELVSLEAARNDIIHAAVANPLYGDMVADLLYHGISDYLAAGTELTKKVPGVGSLVSRGTSAIGKRMGGLEERLRAYISSNLQGVLAKSEAMLKESLTEQRLTELSEHVWVGAKQRPPRLDGYISAENVEVLTRVGTDIWLHFRATPYFRALIADAVDAVYDHAGRKSVASWLEAFGVTQELVAEEVSLQWQALANAREKSDYIEQVVRQRLAAFYEQL